jgi:hypothetical protein
MPHINSNLFNWKILLHIVEHHRYRRVCSLPQAALKMQIVRIATNICITLYWASFLFFCKSKILYENESITHYNETMHDADLDLTLI